MAISDALINGLIKIMLPIPTTSGTGANDPNAGKLFDSGILSPNASYISQVN